MYPVPNDVPASRAVLAANLESAVNGLWDASPRIGDRVAIVGAGTLGCLISWLVRSIPGCSVELIDIDPDKAIVAAALGVVFRSPENAAPEADLVIHTSATEQGLSTAIDEVTFAAAEHGTDDVGLSAVSIVDALCRHVDAIADTIHPANAGDYLDLPDSVRVASIRRRRGVIRMSSEALATTDATIEEEREHVA